MKKTIVSIPFFKGAALLGQVFLIGCQPQAPDKLTPSYPHPIVAYGFVVYGGARYGQMYFVPLKDSTQREVLPTDFRTERLKEGFLFNASSKVRDALSLMDTFSIANQLHDQRLQKYMGRELFTPVRIVYEIDPNALDVFSSPGLVDTITLGRHRYEKSGEKITLIVRFPGADVLKISPIR